MILESVTCLKNDFKLTKFQTFTNTSAQSFFGDAGIFPKYGNTILSSNFRTVVKTGFSINILTNFATHL